jgi:hypothetical protein
MALKVGPNEAERHQVIQALKSGKTFEEATRALRKDVEPDWFTRNEDDLQIVAGKKAKRAATSEERQAAAVLLKQKTLGDELRFSSVDELAPVFPSVDLKTLKPEK